MAGKDDLDLNLAEGEAQEKGKSKLIILIIIATLLVGGGVGAFILISGGDGGSAEPDPESEPVPVQEETIYFKIPNPIVANIPGKKRGRVMQLKVAFQLKSQEAEARVKKHLPLLTNKLLMMISKLSEEDILSKEGKVKLKSDALKLVQDTMQEKEGDPTINKILFTSLVMQ